MAGAGTRKEAALASALRDRVVAVVKAKGYQRLPEPVQLASGAYSQDFIDGKRALAEGADLELACRALLECVEELGVAYDAVGGMTMGADQFAHVLAVLAGTRWFVVRKAPKGRGTNRRIEGARIGAGDAVLLVEDVVTTGGSMLEAYREITATGASVAAAVCLIDRGEQATAAFADLGVPYRALATYADLGIAPVGRDGLVGS